MLQRIFIISAISFLASTITSSACICYYPKTYEAVKNSDIVTVVEIIDTKEQLDLFLYKAVIRRVFKGEYRENDTINIITENWSSCNYEFDNGRRYIFYTWYSVQDTNLTGNIFPVHGAGRCQRIQRENDDEIDAIIEELSPPRTVFVALKRLFRTMFSR